MSQKQALTTEEAIKAAYLHVVEGIDQHVIAVAFSVNHGRVNEAINNILFAIDNGPDITALRRALKKEGT